jgi:hypothetical protein
VRARYHDTCRKERRNHRNLYINVVYSTIFSFFKHRQGVCATFRSLRVRCFFFCFPLAFTRDTETSVFSSLPSRVDCICEVDVWKTTAKDFVRLREEEDSLWLSFGASKLCKLANMKFGKTYSEYIEKEARNHLAGCSYVEFKRLKKVLKKCPYHDNAIASDGPQTKITGPSCSSPSLACSLDEFPVSTSLSSGLKAVWTSSQQKKTCTKSLTVPLAAGTCPSSCPGEPPFHTSSVKLFRILYSL